jgi:hypothetical protein
LKPTPWRVFLSILSILVALGITAALAAQIADLVDRGAFTPENYFSFFSIQTSIANIAVLTVCGVIGLQTARDSARVSAVRGAVVAYSIITAAVYNLLLKNLVEGGTGGTAPLQWPIDLTHVWVPVYLMLDWVISHHRSRIAAWFLLTGLVYPGLWLAATELRGQLTGWYAYDFLDTSGTQEGLVRVLTYSGLLGSFALVCVTVILIINRVHANLSPTRERRR